MADWSESANSIERVCIGVSRVSEGAVEQSDREIPGVGGVGGIYEVGVRIGGPPRAQKLVDVGACLGG